MNNARKQFKKDKKNYEKLLITKAKLGILSLPEKEQYQSMIRSRRRNGLMKKEELRGIGTTLVIGIITAIIYYVGPSIHSQNEDPSIQQTTQNNVQQIQALQQTTTTDKNEVVKEMNACMELSNKANEYFNQGVEEYNTDQRVGISHIEKLTSLYNSEVMAGFKMVNKLFAYKLDKQIDILTHLEDAGENREQMEKDFEDMKRIDKMYQDAIWEILDREGIAYTESR